MLVSGKYRYTNESVGWDWHEILMNVKETKSSYIFTLLEMNGRYFPDYIEMLFSKSNRAVIRKQRSEHPVFVGDNNTWFVIYPYQAGIPFLFELVEEQ